MTETKPKKKLVYIDEHRSTMQSILDDLDGKLKANRIQAIAVALVEQPDGEPGVATCNMYRYIIDESLFCNLYATLCTLAADVMDDMRDEAAQDDDGDD